jgi:hypothetical protein
LLLFKNLPPLAKPLCCTARDFTSNLFPLVTVLGLERNDKGLLFWGQTSLLDAWFEVVFPAFKAGFWVSVKGFATSFHTLRDEIPFFRTILLNIGS